MSGAEQPARAKSAFRIVAASAGALMALGVAWQQGWVSDDAYLTLRTVDNALHGLGLVWNAGYRVQVYTHPLWLAALLPAVALVGDAYWAALGLGLVTTSAGAAAWIARARDPLLALGTLTVLVMSSGFADFATSGLENPLTHALLLALFLSAGGGGPMTRLHRPWLLCSLLFLARPDAILLGAPFVLLAAYQAQRARVPLRRALRAAALGALPLFTWECFSVFYYGSLVPNTAYAKLGAGFPRSVLVDAGIDYLGVSLGADPAACALLAAALLLGLLHRRPKYAAAACGVALYLAYIVWIGGDFMRGRFLTAPVFLAALVVADALARTPRVGLAVFPAAVAIAFAALASPGGLPLVADPPTRGEPEELSPTLAVADERAHYRTHTSVQAQRAGVTPAQHPFARAGTIAREHDMPLISEWTVGMRGYYAGPDVYVLDTLSLGDALLARLPPRPVPHFRPGHLPRAVPPGYREHLVDATVPIEDPSLRAFYDRLEHVIRAPLFEPARVRAAVALAFGGHAAPLPASPPGD